KTGPETWSATALADPRIREQRWTVVRRTRKAWTSKEEGKTWQQSKAKK
ncbi:unnamed protein product, partial [marine sediment metagenome]